MSLGPRPRRALGAAWLGWTTLVAALALAGPEPALLWTAQSAQQGSEFGAAVAGAGDVDGDGYDDLIVGAPRYTVADYREGAALIYAGSPTGPGATPARVVGSGQTGSRFGAAVAGVGDINADGYDDVAVGAPAHNDGAANVGAVFVFHGGGAGLAALPARVLAGGEADAEFGAAVARAGDVNGDGYDDVIVGARWADDAGPGAGAAYLFAGGPAGLGATPAWFAAGSAGGDAFGSAVAGVGDVNGDGYDDVAVGAPHAAAGAGAAYLFAGGPTGLATSPAWSAEGPAPGAAFGAALAAAGDVTGDGFPDLVVGAPGGAGAALLFAGGPAGLNPAPAAVRFGAQDGAGFGDAVGGGDLDGDGFADVVVGADLYTGDQSHEGAIFVYAGNPAGLDPLPAWSAQGDKADTGFGFAAAVPGDLDGDGLADLAAGAPLFRSDHLIVGQARAYRGLPGADRPSIFLPALLRAP